LLAGTGTSFHGALAGQFILRSAGFEAWALRAFELANYPPALRPDDGLILLSHRGSKRFSRESLESFAHESQRWIAITGEGSPPSRSEMKKQSRGGAHRLKTIDAPNAANLTGGNR
jgi:DNA-binding MurR/RpiR family transcriptional regulator